LYRRVSELAESTVVGGIEVLSAIASAVGKSYDRITEYEGHRGEGRWLGHKSLRDLCVDQWCSVGHSNAIVG